jgi:hypothetical protein
MTNELTHKALAIVRNGTGSSIEEQGHAAERYFSVWSEQRDAARRKIISAGRKQFNVRTDDELFAEIDRRLAKGDHTASRIMRILGEKYDTDLITILALLLSLHEMRQNFGDGPEQRNRAMAMILAPTLFSPTSPIALAEEASKISEDVSGNYIRTIPPIMVSSSQGFFDDTYTPGNVYVSIVGDTNAYHVINSCADAPSVLTALDVLCAYRSDQSNFSGLSREKVLTSIMEKSRVFARIFWEWHTSQEQPPARQKTNQDDFFRDRETVEKFEDHLMYDAASILTSGASGMNGWRQIPGQFPCIKGEFSGVKFSLGGIQDQDTPNLETLEVVANADWLDPETSICFEAGMAKWLYALKTGRLTASNAVRIHVDEILELRGRKKHHKGGYRREDKIDIARRLRKLDKLYAKGKYTAPNGKPHRIEGRFISVTIDSEVDSFNEETPFAFLFRPGDASYDYYRGATHLTDYFTVLARLDVNHSAGKSGLQRMAHLIGRYLIYQWRIRESHGNLDQPFHIETILNGARIEKEADPRNYDRFVKQFDDALDLLEKLGFLPPDSWDYLPDATGRLPEHLDPSGGGTRGRSGITAKRKTPGWFERWVTRALVRIAPPATVIEHARLRTEARDERIKTAIASKRRKKSKKTAE